MSKSIGKGSGPLVLLLLVVVAGGLAALGGAAFRAGSGQDWFVHIVPVGVVFLAFLAGGYLWERRVTAETGMPMRGKQPPAKRAWIMTYVPVACLLLPTLARSFLPGGIALVCTTVYWTAVAVGLIALLFVFLSPDPAELFRTARMRQVVHVALWVLGLASGPAAVAMLQLHDTASPSILVAGIAVMTPMLIRMADKYPFDVPGS